MRLLTQTVARTTALFIFTLAFTIGLLFVFAEVATPIVQRTHAEHKLPIHKTLYLERGIYDDQMFHILAAAMEWNQATNGQVVFDIKRLPAKINPIDAIIVFNVTPDYPDIILLDSVKNYSTLGYYNNRGLDYIALVDERITNSNYNAVVMHELGHALGLDHPDTDDHPEIGIGTLMYSVVDAGSNHITNDDLKQLCKLYNCDSSKFHGLP
jgi:hypothetical protein